MRRTFQLLAILAVMASGLAAAVAAVVAFESQVVQVGTSVSNVLRVATGNDLRFDESFPQEFRTSFTHVELSQSFVDAPRVQAAKVEVWLECRPDFTDAQSVFHEVKWMGDFAYLAKTDPFDELPGTATVTAPTTGSPSTGGRIPPNQGGALANPPWEYVGGLPEDCEPGASVPNKIGVFTQSAGNVVFLDKSGDIGVDLFLGLDIPVCDFNFNTSTDPNPKPSGYDEPTIVIKSGDPRYEPQVDDPNCQYFAGMNLVFQVVDIGVGAIIVAQTAGTFLLKWGSSGTGDGQFDHPGKLAVDTAGNVYVGDLNNNRIQKFTSDGVFVTKWGSLGTRDGQFYSPGGVAFGGFRNVYVADTGNHRIQKFTSDGRFVS